MKTIFAFMLPDYNASPEELISFLDDLQSGFNETDAQWYELDIWKSIVKGGKTVKFTDGDRQRLFAWLKNLFGE